MGYETDEGVRFLSLGELTAISKGLDGGGSGELLTPIFHGERVSNAEATAALTVASLHADEATQAIIGRGLARLGALA